MKMLFSVQARFTAFQDKHLVLKPYRETYIRKNYHADFDHRSSPGRADAAEPIQFSDPDRNLTVLLHGSLRNFITPR